MEAGAYSEIRGGVQDLVKRKMLLGCGGGVIFARSVEIRTALLLFVLLFAPVLSFISPFSPFSSSFFLFFREYLCIKPPP